MSSTNREQKGVLRPEESSSLPPGRPSLADAQMGEVVRVVGIFFETVRNRCWRLGILEGEIYRCLGLDRDRGTLLLFHPIHGSVRVEKEVARFVSTTLVSAMA